MRSGPRSELKREEGTPLHPHLSPLIGVSRVIIGTPDRPHQTQAPTRARLRVRTHALSQPDPFAWPSNNRATMPQMLGILLLPSLLACNVDSGLSTRNEPPQVALASPVDLATLPAGTPIVFVAAISDDYTALDDLVIVFGSDPQGGLDGELELRDGSVRFTSEPLVEAIHTITLSVTDEDAEVGEDTVTLEVLPNTPPTLSIIRPTPGQAFEDGDDVVVEVQVTDTTEEDLTAMVLTLTVDGLDTGAPTSPDSDGLATLTASGLELGNHAIAVTVTDTPGESATDTTEVDLVLADADEDGFITDRLGGDDCDDDDETINPDALEVCDEADTDEDCDGLADDADDSVTDPVEIWPDTDGDGFGDPEGATWTCEPDSGVDNDLDCNDSDADTNPDATEVCDDGLDNDCDGAWSSCRYHGEVDPFSADAVVYGDGSYDRAGYALDSADMDNDGLGDLIIGASQDSTVGEYAGALHISLGPHRGESVLGGSEPTWTGELERSMAGSTVANLGDVDGDGFVDLAVGAPEDDTDGNGSGRAYLLRGPVTTSGDLGLQDTWSGGQPNTLFGSSVAPAGDVNGDGLADVLFGAPSDDGLFSDGGAAYLVLGPASATGSIDEVYDGRFRSEDTKDELGTAIGSAGDVNGDGLDDMLFSAPKRNDLGTDSGVVYLVFGSSSYWTGVSQRLNRADAKLRGHEYDLRAGSAVAALGDLDSDGFGDVVIGAASQSDPGKVFLLRGPLTGEISLANADITFAGDKNGSRTGYSLATGDTDGDGEVDLLIGSREHPGNTDTGRVSLLHGPLLDLGPDFDLGTGLDATWDGEHTNDYLGNAIRLTDLDADGKDEILIGTPRDDTETTDAGAVFVFAGQGL